MQDNTATQQQAPATPANPSAASLAALKAALATATDTVLVEPEENDKKIKSLMKDAKALLKELRSGTDPIEEADEPTDEELPNANSAKVVNANISPDQQRQIDLATEQFKQSVTRVDNQLLQQYIQAIQDGDYKKAEQILEKAEESQQQHTLAFALLTIGVILLPLYAKQRIQSLFAKFGLHTVFAQTTGGQKALKEQADKGATSHVRTIAKDLKKSLDDAIDGELTTPSVEAAVKDKYPEVAEIAIAAEKKATTDKAQAGEKAYVKAVKNDQEIYSYARDLILSGASKDVVIKKLQENFSDVSKKRATVIAGNEANRVFTVSQFDADAQFLAQNKLTDKAYKRLVSNTGTPEAICKAIIDITAKKPIPFNQDFIKFGQTFTTKTEDGKTLKFKPTYEHLKSGHIHVNCHCRYELLIQRDDGTFMNTYTWKIENDIDFTEDLHPRDKGGKFAKKGTISGDSILDVSKLGNKKAFDDFVANNKMTYTKQQEFTASKYQSHWGYTINNAYRTDTPVIKMNDDRVSSSKFAQVFDSAFNMTIPDESTLFRGVGDSPNDFIVGKNYLDKGYTSSTSVEDTARKKFKGPGGAVIHLTVPAGQKVAVPDVISGKTTLDEQEVLLPRGTSYSVYKIDGDIVYAVVV